LAPGADRQRSLLGKPFALGPALTPVKIFQTRKTLAFGDADAAGVVFYPRLLALAHEAVEDLLRQAPCGWDAWFASARHAAPIRRADADFFLPMRPGETFDVRAAIEETGGSSVIFTVDFLDLAGRHAARVRTVHVFIARPSGERIPVPDEIRAALQ
jgi:1,4-dihydroxy-2-naphthoyl-CoA hydrolase